MSERPRILVVIPAYNESESIVSTVESVVASGFDYVVINDGSTDNTLEICRSAGINVVDLPQNLGIGGAVQCGHKYAKEHGYDVDVQVDGDGQHDPSYIGRLIEEVNGGADLVIGSRFIEKTDGFQSTFMRRLGITWLSGCIRLMAGKAISDPTSGFRACGHRAIDMYCADYPVDYPEPESIAVALRSGLDVREVPVKMRERQGGASSIGGLSTVYYMIKVTLAIAIAGLGRRSK